MPATTFVLRANHSSGKFSVVIGSQLSLKNVCSAMECISKDLTFRSYNPVLLIVLLRARSSIVYFGGTV